MSCFNPTCVMLLAAGATAVAALLGEATAQVFPAPGVLSPVVGSGGVYELTRANQKRSWTVAVVGKEAAGGEEGYWIERRSPATGGERITKQLMLIRAGKPEVKRVITQSPRQPPMEMPLDLVNAMAREFGDMPSSFEKEGGKLVKIGTESVTVPAGTFRCDHYRVSFGSETSDTWVAIKGPPHGVVKSVRGESTMVLVKVLENETSHIQGQPEPFRPKSRRPAGGPSN